MKNVFKHLSFIVVLSFISQVVLASGPTYSEMMKLIKDFEKHAASVGIDQAIKDASTEQFIRNDGKLYLYINTLDETNTTVANGSNPSIVGKPASARGKDVEKLLNDLQAVAIKQTTGELTYAWKGQTKYGYVQKLGNKYYLGSGYTTK